MQKSWLYRNVKKERTSKYNNWQNSIKVPFIIYAESIYGVFTYTSHNNSKK